MSHAPSPATDDADSFTLSTTPTPAPLRSFSQWSATEAPPHHHQGTSYYSQPPSPILNRARRTTRSTSISSSQATNRHRDDEILSEDDEDNSRRRGKAPAESPDNDLSGEGDEGDEGDIDEDDPITTVKDRQSLINVQHPFGLPIWKPALYKKSRTVTRLADEALHSIPSAQAERHLLPGNLFWAFAFGWWLGLICIVISFFLYLVPQGDQHYSNLVYGLGWYLAWPFGKYLEGDINELEAKDDDEGSPPPPPPPRRLSQSYDTGISQPRQDDETELPKHPPLSQYSTITPETVLTRGQNVSWASEPARESTPLLGHKCFPVPSKSYGTTVLPLSTTSSRTVDPETDCNESPKGNLIGKVFFWLALVSIIAPLMLFVCMICWFLVVTIPMAKLNWALIQYLFTRPTQIRFCAAPPVVIVSSADQQGGGRSEHEHGQDNEPPVAQFSFKHPRLSAGQAAPSGSPTSTVLLCTYRAVGFKFYKYTVGGVNILFVNLLPIVFFVIFDGLFLLPLVEEMERNGNAPAFLSFIASKGLIFILCLTSVIPLSYFIGMAVASISAQSSIGMGAVINATFGSIIEIILYGMALMQGKGHLVEGSIVGSLLAGVLLMPGMSMCSGALRRKEQKFNAKSAGVTSMMLIMAIIGALAPTLFYQTYGNVWNSMSFLYVIDIPSCSFN
jgi:Ca2+:H+ antiporter